MTQHLDYQHAATSLAASPAQTAQRALVLLRRIHTLLEGMPWQAGHGCVLACVDPTDGSTTVEWIRPHSRLGFVVSQDQSSSWFLVLSTGRSLSGVLADWTSMPTLCAVLEAFVTAGEPGQQPGTPQ